MMNHSAVARERHRDLRNQSRKLQAAETRARELRHDLDRLLYRWHEDGSSVTELSLDSGLSRETVYRSLERYRRELASQGLSGGER
jgi:transcriptional regulator of acetoin/glycerol metabolism